MLTIAGGSRGRKVGHEDGGTVGLGVRDLVGALDGYNVGGGVGLCCK
jgi:hypothetical protein